MKASHNDAETRVIAEQAAQWLADLNDDGAAVEPRLLEWMRQSPRHVEEFLFACSLWQEVSQLRSPTFDLDALIARARADERSNVFTMPNAPIEAAETSDDAAHGTLRKRRSIYGLAASVVLALAIGVAVFVGMRAPTYSTDVGEQRSIALADGSVIDLNTSSRVEVRYSERERTILLLEGEALFTVQHDATRPFVVNVADTQVRALGTEFNVYRTAHGTEVTVRSGTVQITRASEVQTVDAPRTLLTTGQAARIEASGQVSRSDADATTALMWRDRMLVFVGEPLEKVADEFNRYNRRKIEVKGTDARQKLLSGTFRADNPESLLLFLRRLDDLTVESTGERTVIRTKSDF